MTDIAELPKDAALAKRYGPSPKEIAMRSIGSAIAMCIRAIETIPSRGANPMYALGWADCKATAAKRLTGVMVQTLKEMEAQPLGERVANQGVEQNGRSSSPGSSASDPGNSPIANPGGPGIIITGR